LTIYPLIKWDFCVSSFLILQASRVNGPGELFTDPDYTLTHEQFINQQQLEAVTEALTEAVLNSIHQRHLRLAKNQ
jgi:hypothetical protein